MKAILQNREQIGPMGRLAYQEAERKYLSDRNTEEIERFYQVVRQRYDSI